MSVNIDSNSFWDGLRKFLIIVYKDHPIIIMVFTGTILLIAFCLCVGIAIKWINKESKISKIEEHTKKILDYFTGNGKKKGK